MFSSDNQARCDYISWSWNSISPAQFHFLYLILLVIIIILSALCQQIWVRSQCCVKCWNLKLKMFKPLCICECFFPNYVGKQWCHNPWILKNTDVTQIHKTRNWLGFEDKQCMFFFFFKFLFVGVGILNCGR